MAFVGGGGKTTAILRLVAELAAVHIPVVATTTTRVGPSMSGPMPVVVACPSTSGPATHGDLGEVARRLGRALERGGQAFLRGPAGPGGKVLGVDPELLNQLSEEMPGTVFLVEADGARQRSIKAPAGHEPVVPGTATLIVPVVGLDAVNRKFEDVAHRPELIRELTPGETVTPTAIASLLLSESCGMKDVPPSAAVRPLLNKARTCDLADALDVARAVLGASGDRLTRVVVADVLASEFSFLEVFQSGPA